MGAYCAYLIVNQSEEYTALLEELMFELEHRRMASLDSTILLLLLSSHVQAQLHSKTDYSPFFSLCYKWIGKNTQSLPAHELETFIRLFYVLYRKTGII